MTSLTATRLTIDQFLEIPEEAPYQEFYRGEIWEKAMPNRQLGECVIELGTELNLYLRESGEGRVATEVRHADRDQDWVYLPDLQVTLNENRRPSAPGPVDGHPDFAIEVLSPDDRTSRVLAKVGLYMAAGTALLWVIDPEDETVTVYRQGEPVSVHGAGDTLDAKPVLRSFALDLDSFFARIRPAA